MDALTVLVGVPVLDRPQNARTVVDSIRETAPDAHIVFLCSPGDQAEINACFAAEAELVATMEWPQGPGDFARKHNWGFTYAVERGYEWYFVGADDLRFHRGWLNECLRQHEKTLACVIGTNDLGNRRTMTGRHSTHFLVHTGYSECGGVIDDSELALFHTGYQHEFVDDEAVQTAQFRGSYAHAYNAIVEHLHPDWGKSARDGTYERAQAGRLGDQALYQARRHLWTRGFAVARR